MPGALNLYIGADTSKGYADFCVMGGEGQVLCGVQLDDTRRGHDRMADLIDKLSRKVSAEEALLVGMEATGGLEVDAALLRLHGLLPRASLRGFPG